MSQKMFENIFLSLKFRHVTHMQDLKKCPWLVKIVKLRKCQKIKIIENFNKILLKLILVSSDPFHYLERLSSIPISSVR